jgi:hypothetical protein
VRARPFHRNFPEPLPSTLDEITNGRRRAAGARARPPRCRSPLSGGGDVPRRGVKFPDLPGGIGQVGVIQLRRHIVFLGLCQQSAEPQRLFEELERDVERLLSLVDP